MKKNNFVFKFVITFLIFDMIFSILNLNCVYAGSLKKITYRNYSNYNQNEKAKVTYTTFNGSYLNGDGAASMVHYNELYCNTPENLNNVDFSTLKEKGYIRNAFLANQGFIRTGFNIINFSHIAQGYNSATYGAVIELYNRGNSNVEITLSGLSSVDSGSKFWYHNKLAEEISGLYTQKNVTYMIFDGNRFVTKQAKNLTMKPGDSIWFFMNNTINSSNDILDGYLMVHSVSDYISTVNGVSCPSIVASEYIYKGASESPINRYYEYYNLRALNCGNYSLAPGCASFTYNTYKNNYVSTSGYAASTVATYTNVLRESGLNTTLDDGTVVQRTYKQYGASNYIPQIKIDVNLNNTTTGFISYDAKNYSSITHSLNTNVASENNVASSTNNDIVALSNSYFNNTAFGWYGSLSECFKSNINKNSKLLNRNEANWANWSIPTNVKYTITNTSTKTKDYVIYLDSQNTSNTMFSRETEGSGNGASTFVYRYADKSYGYSVANSSSINNYSSNSNMSFSKILSKNSTIANSTTSVIVAIDSIAPGETKTIEYTSYLINQATGTLMHKMYVENNVNNTSNVALETLKINTLNQ